MRTAEEILKAEYSKLIANPEKVYLQNPSIIKAAHSAINEAIKEAIEEIANKTYIPYNYGFPVTTKREILSFLNELK